MSDQIFQKFDIDPQPAATPKVQESPAPEGVDPVVAKVARRAFLTCLTHEEKMQHRRYRGYCAAGKRMPRTETISGGVAAGVVVRASNADYLVTDHGWRKIEREKEVPFTKSQIYLPKKISHGRYGRALLEGQTLGRAARA